MDQQLTKKVAALSCAILVVPLTTSLIVVLTLSACPPPHQQVASTFPPSCEIRKISLSADPPCVLNKLIDKFAVLMCEGDTFFLGKPVSGLSGELGGVVIPNATAHLLFNWNLPIHSLNVSSWRQE